LRHRLGAADRSSHCRPKGVFIVERHANPARVDGKRRSKRKRQIEHILLGANERMRAGCSGCALQIPDFSAGIAMMIGKAALAHHGKAPVFQVIEEGPGISDAAKGEKLALPPLAFRQNFDHRGHSERS